MRPTCRPVTAAGCLCLSSTSGTASVIHETAIVDEGAMVGEGTDVWHWTHVCTGAVIGKHCVLGQNVYVGGAAAVGDRVKIQNNVSVFDRVTLKDGVFCGPGVVFTNVINPRSDVPRKQEYRETLVNEGATLGANATIVCGHVVGCYALVGAGAVVSADVPDYALVVGVPARQIGWVSRRGVRLDLPLTGEQEARCPEDGSLYLLRGSSVVYGGPRV